MKTTVVSRSDARNDTPYCLHAALLANFLRRFSVRECGGFDVFLQPITVDHPVRYGGRRVSMNDVRVYSLLHLSDLGVNLTLQFDEHIV